MCEEAGGRGGGRHKRARRRATTSHDLQIVERDSEIGAELLQFLPEGPRGVMLFLPLNVSLNRSDSIRTYRKCSEAALPSEHRNALAQPIA